MMTCRHEDMQVIMEVHKFTVLECENVRLLEIIGVMDEIRTKLALYVSKLSEFNAFGCFISYVCFTFWIIFGSLDV